MTSQEMELCGSEQYSLQANDFELETALTDFPEEETITESYTQHLIGLLAEGSSIFEVIRSISSETEIEERYSRKEKSLSQLSKRFLAEFGYSSNTLISMFEVTDKLSKFKLCQKSKGEESTISSIFLRVLE